MKFSNLFKLKSCGCRLPFSPCFSASLPLLSFVLCFIGISDQRSQPSLASMHYYSIGSGLSPSLSDIGMFSQCLCSTLSNNHQCFSSINKHGQFWNKPFFNTFGNSLICIFFKCFLFLYMLGLLLLDWLYLFNIH